MLYCQMNGVKNEYGAKALNMLGLSTQVPAQNIHYTNFTNKDVTVGTQTVFLVPSQIS